ncbi:Lon protease family protein [Hydrocarboniclastica marina]|uniref:endopeptidase La n=1 Tax=Hydrocarboniclastica marina TaxID=2259620 RepID=A0A4P7XEN2_9ALTE|nr:ATP-binding protein [Hydrocarboniclastica marina]MAL96978.1 ATP-dependent protease [Alteromonadaceae bacterium]QCF25399.1 ATP-binding protein [Hydrocarboniclastica marina]
MKPLAPSKLYKPCTQKDLPFRSTRSLKPLNEIVGQGRAQEAVRFAMAMPHGGYNVYAVGANGLGKRTMMMRYLDQFAEHEHSAEDWCYVPNYDDPREPKVLRLPPSMGHQLKQDLEKLMARLVNAIPQAFDNERFLDRAEKLKNEYGRRHEGELAKLAAEARKKGVDLSVTTPGGYRLVGMNGDEPHTTDSFAALAAEEREALEEKINKLEKKLRRLLRRFAEWEQEYTEKQLLLNQETIDSVAAHLLQALAEKYQSQPQIVEHLEAMREDMVDNLDIFLEDSEDQAAFAYAALDRKMPRRYLVNLLVHHKNDKVPVIVEDNPTYHNLFGYVENVTYKGTVFTDFSLIRPGSLHKANGGYLLMDAIKVLEQPYVWDGLKRALRSRQLTINSLERELTFSGTISLEPEPIPLEVKIVLFGDRETWLLLQEHDPEFAELFRVTADFENEMPRTPESQSLYAKFIASLVVEKDLLHCSRTAVARIIEYSARLAEHQDRLSLHAADIANLLRESDFWARQSKARQIGRDHIDQALESARHRSSRIRDHIYQSIADGTTLLSVTGLVVGQVNALSVLSTGGYEFGMPNRISAVCHYGDGDIIDIERDVKLGGSMHSKGVLILSSWLASHFARTHPMHLSASLTFEQSYSEVDGDSASLAELCALISALSEIPIQQRFAVTGSVNQFGEVQPVGGLNEKIEGFFDACELKGLSGDQGVIIPSTNVSNLMLNEKVMDAAKAGKFTIHAVTRVEDAVELLMGKAAGKAGRGKRYLKGTVFGAIQKRLDDMRAEERAEQSAGLEQLEAHLHRQ